MSTLASRSVSDGLVSPALLFEVVARVFKGIAPCSCESISPEMAVPLAGWQGVIDFCGPGVGSVGVCVPTGYAEVLAWVMAGEEARTNPALQADAVGETTNILSSSVMALLYGRRRHARLSSPTVSGNVMELPSGPPEGLTRLGVLVDGEHLVQVWLRVVSSSSKSK